MISSTRYLNKWNSLRYSGIFGLHDGKLAKRLDEEFEQLAATTLLFEDTCPNQNRVNSSKLIREFYLGDKPIDETARNALTDVR